MKEIRGIQQSAMERLSVILELADCGKADLTGREENEGHEPGLRRFEGPDDAAPVELLLF